MNTKINSLITKEAFLNQLQNANNKALSSLTNKTPIDTTASLKMLYGQCIDHLEIMEDEYFKLSKKLGEPIESRFDFANATVMMDLLLTQIHTIGLFDAQKLNPDDSEINDGLDFAKGKLLDCHAKEITLFRA